MTGEFERNSAGHARQKEGQRSTWLPGNSDKTSLQTNAVASQLIDHLQVAPDTPYWTWEQDDEEPWRYVRPC